jgi:hypothetical protein
MNLFAQARQTPYRWSPTLGASSDGNNGLFEIGYSDEASWRGVNHDDVAADEFMKTDHRAPAPGMTQA